MNIDELDYPYPESLVAQRPQKIRDRSRLLVLSKEHGGILHYRFSDLPSILSPGDLLVLNKAKVEPVRLYGQKISGMKVEMLLLDRISKNGRGEEIWESLINPAHRLRPGVKINLGDRFSCELQEKGQSGIWKVISRLTSGKSFDVALDKIGAMPLPPYISREEPLEEDRRWYQTVFAETPGAVAAPTAGLHFTDKLIERLKNKGVDIAFVTLHVGIGTFLPIRVKDVRKHNMHSEDFSISEEAAKKINLASQAGKRIIAVGTTTTRVLESLANGKGLVKPGAGSTTLFIYPGYKFKIIDGLITNFHQPRSTLLAMVSAFVGLGEIKESYQEAIRKKYRLFSYGDAMLIL